MSTQTSHHPIPMFPALRVLEQSTPPVRHGRVPLWRLPAEQEVPSAYIPVWNWTAVHDFPTNATVRTLDTNGAYLAAISSATIAHSHLTRRGPLTGLDEPGEVMPGYYRIRTPHWAFDGTIVSPLGNSTRVATEEQLWVAAPTLVLLLELVRDGYLGGVVITDALTANVSTTFREWAARIRQVRTHVLDDLDGATTEEDKAVARERYDALKTGYSSALSMMLTGTKCATRRPDWTHTVHAQHAASQWRRAWRYSFGSPLVSMGNTDEIVILDSDFQGALHATKPPFRYDSTGRILGALKTKSVGPIKPPPAAPVTATETEDDGDIV
jgi:hypothetical protein